MDGMVVVRRWVCDQPRRVIWVAATDDRTSWHVWWGPDGGPYEHRWPSDSERTRVFVGELRRRAGGQWRDVTGQPGPG